MTDRELLDRKGHEVTDDLPPLPDQYDAAAHMYPWDIEDFQTGEKTGVVFSIPVGCPDGKSVPLWTSEQMRAYARAAVLAERERWQGRKMWLWQNFVNGRREYWAFDNPYPVHMNYNDPQTLGEPCGYALFKPSRNGRPDVPESKVLAAVQRVWGADAIRGVKT